MAAHFGFLLGGLLLEWFWWGSVFLINVPVAVAALVLGWWLVPNSRDPHPVALDLPGALLSISWVSLLVYAIIEAPNLGWSDPLTLAGFAGAAVLAALFFWWEARTDHPMLDITFFKNPRFSAASGAITLVFFAMFGSLFLLTQYLQFVLGYSPLEAGVRMLPFAAVMMVVAPSSARVVQM